MRNTLHVRPTQREKAEAFRALHEGDPFVIPNPWDAGSARVLEALGFKALASTTRLRLHARPARRSGDARRGRRARRALNAATALPVSIDLENGYGPQPEDAAHAEESRRGGAVGGSIEDYDPSGRLYELAHALERVTAAVEEARRQDFPFTLTARAENHIRGNPDLADTISRLQAFEEAGADVLYAPGLRSVEEVRAVCEAVAKPVNVLAVPGVTMAQLVDAGARRVSVGGGLTWVALSGMVAAAEAIRDRGDFGALAARVSVEEWLAPR